MTPLSQNSMPTRSIAFIVVLTLVLLTRAVCAQTFSSTSTSMLELATAVGAVFYHVEQKESVIRGFVEERARWLVQQPIRVEEINDDIEKPYDDEDNLEGQLPSLYGHIDGLDVLIKGKKASFKTSRPRDKPTSRLNQLMHELNINQIDIQPGRLDIFPENPLEPPVSVILPSVNEPFMPVEGFDWLNESEGLAYVLIQNMDDIAAISEKTVSMRTEEAIKNRERINRERTNTIDHQDAQIDLEDQVDMFEDLGGQLYKTDILSYSPPASIKLEVKQEIESMIAELEFGNEGIALNITLNSEGKILGSFEYLIKKANGGDKKSEEDDSSETDSSDQSNNSATDSEGKNNESKEAEEPVIGQASSNNQPAADEKRSSSGIIYSRPKEAKQPIASTEAKNFQVNAPSTPNLKPNIDIERFSEGDSSVSQGEISLSERKATCKKYIQVLNSPELYIKEKGRSKNPIVLPFYLEGNKNFKIDPNTPLLNHDCNLEILGDNQEQLNAWTEAVKRISNIFTHGFNSVCKVTSPEEKTCKIDGNCHHFVNYLAFGMDQQEDIYFLGWYENLPFSLLLQFDEKDLKWGDVVQLLDKGKLKHSMFYIGNGKYINKHGSTEIYFQDLRGVQKQYPSDSVRIIRVSPDYYSSENIFKELYSCRS